MKKHFYNLLIVLFVSFGFSNFTNAQLLSEDFSSASGTTPPTNWTVTDNNSSGQNWEFNNPGGLATGFTGNFAILDSDNYGSGGSQNSTLESPTFNANVAGAIFLNFNNNFYVCCGAVGTVEVFDGTNWTSVLSLTSTDGYPTSNSKSIDITSATGGNSGAKVRFSYTGSWDYWWAIDDISIAAISCAPPSALGVTSLTSSSADLGWTAGGTETLWDVEWGTNGFTQGNGTTVSGTTNPTSISGLSAQTAYEFYVRSDCNGSTSSWAGPYTFYTGYCSPSSIGTATYVDNFSTSGGSVNISNMASGFTAGGYADLSATNSVETYAGGSFNFTADIVGGTAGFSIWIDWNNDLVFDNATEKFYNTTGYSNGPFSGTINTPTTIANGNYRMRITTDYNSANPADPCATARSRAEFEDYAVTIVAPPTCVPPTALSIANLTATSANLGWTAGGTETSWDIEWGTTGFSQGSGTLVSATSSNPYSLSGLSPNTNYQFYVRADCGNNDLSPWAGPFSFTTNCAAYTTGYFQNFDGTSDPNIDACWSVIEATATSTGSATTAGWIYTENSTFDPRRSGVNSIEIYNSLAMQGLLALVSPEFSDLDNTKRVRFYVQDKASTSYTSNLIVGVMSDPTDTSTFTPIDTVFKSELSANWLEVTVNLPSGLGKHVVLAHGMNSTYDYLWIDDFYYENIPNCFKPSNFTASNVTATSADFTWTANSYPNNWEVEYGAAGYTPGTGTSTFVSDTLTTISNLSDATTYDFYVREICSAGDSSFFEGPLQITTLCNAFNAPYFEGFESGFANGADIGLCYSQESVSGTLAWVANSTNTSYNTTPKSGNFNATLRYSNEDWLFIQFDLTGGKEYTFELFARQDGSNANNSNITVGYGSSNNSASMTNTIVPATGIVNGNYQQITGNFRPSSSGIYYIGIKGFMNGSPWYISIDDISLVETPFSANASSSTNMACAGDTVYLYGSSAGGAISKTYSWSPSTNLMGASNDTAWFVASTSEDYVFTVNDGVSSVMDTVSVLVNAAPSVSISSSGSPWCDMVDLWVSSNGPGMAMWSNGASGPYTSVSLADGIAPNVSVMVMDTNGCVGSASGFVYADEYLQNYVMVAKNSIELPKKNKVIGGGVGVTDLGGMASIGNFSGPESTNGFVIADNLNLGNSANYAYFSDTTASALILPNHNSSNASGTTRSVKAQRGATKTVNARNVNVIAERNSTVTLTSNLYGVILVKVGATVIFTDNNVQIGDLYVQNSANSSQGATISFAQSCDFRVANYVYLGARSNFNPSMEDVTVYVGSSTSGGDFEFKPADTEINANIYVMGGNVMAASSNSKKWSSVNGRVIADEIYSKAEYIRWSGPTCNPMVLTPLAQKKSEVSAQQVEEVALTQVVTDGVEFTLAPNPTSGVFSMQLNGSLVNSTEDIQVTITSQDGRMVENKTFNNLSGSFNREFSLEKYSNGIYFVTILVGNEILKEKIVLTR